jgi:protein tyrosine/serine phosphatase
MSVAVRWSLGLLIAAFLVVVPFVHYRWVYTHGKRLRDVQPGVFYRSGEMTGDGFTETIKRLGLRTIINLQDEYPDPDLSWGYFGGGTIKESELCARLGVRYVYIPPNLLPRRQIPARRPEAIDRFLTLLDDPKNYPVLIHCRAGLHRTGVMTAVYRMEYCGWTARQAVDELKANGFGEYPCTPSNDYIMQYILTYQRGLRQTSSVARSQ